MSCENKQLKKSGKHYVGKSLTAVPRSILVSFMVIQPISVLFACLLSGIGVFFFFFLSIAKGLKAIDTIHRIQRVEQIQIKRHEPIISFIRSILCF